MSWAQPVSPASHPYETMQQKGIERDLLYKKHPFMLYYYLVSGLGNLSQQGLMCFSLKNYMHKGITMLTSCLVLIKT